MTNQMEIVKYMRNDKVVERFAEVLGQQNAGAFISSVLIAVRNSDALMACQPESIMLSAMRAATLRLSCDPAVGHAWLIPFKGKCVFIPGYRGLVHMALRTGKYRHINVATIYQGQEVIEDQLTGMHSIEGARTSKEAIGWLLYIKMISGFEKTLYMTAEEIRDHAKKYSKSYGNKESPWTTNFADMAKKTLIRQGSKWMYFDPTDAAMLTVSEEDETGDESIVDAPAFDEVMQEVAEEEAQKEPLTEDEILRQMGF